MWDFSDADGLYLKLLREMQPPAQALSIVQRLMESVSVTQTKPANNITNMSHPTPGHCSLIFVPATVDLYCYYFTHHITFSQT